MPLTFRTTTTSFITKSSIKR